jgi:hypothetical protein
MALVHDSRPTVNTVVIVLHCAQIVEVFYRPVQFIILNDLFLKEPKAKWAAAFVRCSSSSTL